MVTESETELCRIRVALSGRGARKQLPSILRRLLAGAGTRVFLAAALLGWGFAAQAGDSDPRQYLTERLVAAMRVRQPLPTDLEAVAAETIPASVASYWSLSRWPLGRALPFNWLADYPEVCITRVLLTASFWMTASWTTTRSSRRSPKLKPRPVVSPQACARARQARLTSARIRFRQTSPPPCIRPTTSGSRGVAMRWPGNALGLLPFNEHGF